MSNFKLHLTPLDNLFIYREWHIEKIEDEEAKGRGNWIVLPIDVCDDATDYLESIEKARNKVDEHIENQTKFYPDGSIITQEEIDAVKIW